MCQSGELAQAAARLQKKRVMINQTNKYKVNAHTCKEVAIQNSEFTNSELSDSLSKDPCQPECTGLKKSEHKKVMFIVSWSRMQWHGTCFRSEGWYNYVSEIAATPITTDHVCEGCCSKIKYSEALGTKMGISNAQCSGCLGCLGKASPESPTYNRYTLLKIRKQLGKEEREKEEQEEEEQQNHCNKLITINKHNLIKYLWETRKRERKRHKVRNR